MGQHDGTQSFIHQYFKWKEFEGIEVRIGMIDHRQSVVAVGLHIPMTGKVFTAGNDAIVLQGVHIHEAFQRHIVLILSERAVADHRVLGIIIDIYHRRKAHMHAQPFQLPGDDASGLIHQ